MSPIHFLCYPSESDKPPLIHLGASFGTQEHELTMIKVLLGTYFSGFGIIVTIADVLRGSFLLCLILAFGPDRSYKRRQGHQAICLKL